MNEQQNIQKIGELYAAYGRGDVATIVLNLTDDVKWVSHNESIVPWGGDFSGKDRVPRFFEAITQAADTEVFEPQEWVAQGDAVVSVGEYACRVKATGKRVRSRWVFLWKFRGDKICSYEQFHDPALRDAFR